MAKIEKIYNNLKIIKTFKMFVPGIARTAGSHVAFGNRITHAGKFTKQWMDKISWFALKEYGQRQILHEGPVEIEIQFYLQRPERHYGTGRNRKKLKPSSPICHISEPDGDKLRRAVQDALTGIIYKDDKQIIHGQEWKYYADGEQKPGALIKVIMFDENRKEY